MRQNCPYSDDRPKDDEVLTLELPDMPDTDFVTIAQAAAELGISERTAHRYAVKLSASDRQKADNAPLMVRLSGMREKLTYRAKAATDSQSSASDSHMADGVNGDSKPDARDELIAQLRQENARVWQAFERQQILTQDAQRIAQHNQERIELLEAQNAKLIGALPLADSDGQSQTEKSTLGPYDNTASNMADSDRQNTVSVPPESPLGDTTDAGRENIPPKLSEGKKEQRSRRWWEVWKR